MQEVVGSNPVGSIFVSLGAITGPTNVGVKAFLFFGIFH